MPDDDGRPWVVLLHGLAQGTWSMSALARDLKKAGHRVHNMGYPSRSLDVASLVERYVRPAIEACGHNQPVHLVTHSLGGILVRYYLQKAGLPEGSRIVMLAPPNHGSEVADHLRNWPLYRWWMGTAGQQLGTGEDSVVHELNPIDAEVGIIAANRTLQPWFSHLIPGEDDGAVSVESTRLDEMSDFLVVPSSHTLVTFNSRARRQVGHFLRCGYFAR